MKLLCLLVSLLLHSIFLIKLGDGKINNETISTTREVIAIRVKGIKKSINSLMKKSKKSNEKVIADKKSESNTKLIEAQSKSTIKPIYPERARLLGLEGKATVIATIDADGSVLSVRLTESSGYEILDSEIIRAVKNGSFKPATQNGEPMRSEKEITFNYGFE